MNYKEKVLECMEDIKRWCKNPKQQLIYERNSREAIKQNNETDEFLKTTDTVPDALWIELANAIGYDSASTVGWATKKLAIIYKRTQLGETIFVSGINVMLDRQSFKGIICNQFSEFIYNEILKNATSSE
jgi:hypothetical protein